MSFWFCFGFFLGVVWSGVEWLGLAWLGFLGLGCLVVWVLMCALFFFG